MNTLKIEIPEGFKVESFDEKKGIVKFAPKDIKDRVKSFDDALEVLGEKDVDVKDYWTMVSAALQHSILANQELIIIAKALNEGWKPDWSNLSEYKYSPWFKMNSSSGVGFAYRDYDNWRTHSYVGSCLCFKSSELAKYAGTQFLEVYRKVYTK
jgi:hypothetical protein